MTSQHWHKDILPEDVALAENAYKEATKNPLIQVCIRLYKIL